MTEILIIQIFYLGTPIHHVQPIVDHGYLNRTICLDIRNEVRKRWKAKGAEIIYVDCPSQWSET
jgi:hypothetical protein